MVNAYTEAGVTGALSIIDLEFHLLLPERQQFRPVSLGIGGHVLRAGSRGSFDYGATRGSESFGTLGASKGIGESRGYEEAIIATGGESSMNTRKVQREEDESAPVIRFSLEIVAAPASSVRIPNVSQAPRQIFVW
jgi:hypothetical protein